MALERLRALSLRARPRGSLRAAAELVVVVAPSRGCVVEKAGDERRLHIAEVVIVVDVVRRAAQLELREETGVGSKPHRQTGEERGHALARDLEVLVGCRLQAEQPLEPAHDGLLVCERGRERDVVRLVEVAQVEHGRRASP